LVAVSQDTRLGTLSALADPGVLPRALAPNSCGFTCQGATGFEAKQKTEASTELKIGIVILCSMPTNSVETSVSTFLI